MPIKATVKVCVISDLCCPQIALCVCHKDGLNISNGRGSVHVEFQD